MHRSFCLSAILIGGLLSLDHATNDFGIKFLEENKERDGIIETMSGMQYKWLRRGEGLYYACHNCNAKIMFEGWTAQEWSKSPQGVHFDISTADNAPTIPIGWVIDGWTEALPMMVVGDKMEIYLPSDLGHGDKGKPDMGIGGGDALVFSMELLKIDIQGDDLNSFNTCVVLGMTGCTPAMTEYVNKHRKDTREQLKSEQERLRAIAPDDDHDPDLDTEACLSDPDNEERRDRVWISIQIYLIEQIKEFSQHQECGLPSLSRRDVVMSETEGETVGMTCVVLGEMDGCTPAQKKYLNEHKDDGLEELNSELLRPDDGDGSDLGSDRINLIQQLKDLLLYAGGHSEPDEL